MQCLLPVALKGGEFSRERSGDASEGPVWHDGFIVILVWLKGHHHCELGRHVNRVALLCFRNLVIEYGIPFEIGARLLLEREREAGGE